MKTYIIGRQEDCDITIFDPTQMVSRHHAVLTVSGTKMTITDQSSNGTYINGIKIAPGAPVPVTRKDVVSFAQAAELNWSRIPDPSKKLVWWVLIAVAVLALAGGGFYFEKKDRNKKANEDIERMRQDSTLRVTQAKQLDSLLTECAMFESKCDSLTKEVKAVQDIINTKKTTKELNEAIKQLAKVETDIQSVKYKEFLSKVNMAKGQAASSGFDRNAFQKDIDDLVKAAETFKVTIKRAESNLADIRKKVESIPNVGKPTPHPVKPEKEDNTTNPNDMLI